MTSRKRQALETRNRLYEVSIKLIREKGYDNIKLEELCAEAGVSVGAFYHHFKNKAGIIVEAYRRVDERFNSEIMAKLQPGSACERIIEYLGYQATETERFGVDVISQIYKAQLSDATEFFLSPERGLPSNLHNLVEKAQDAGELTAEIDSDTITEDLLLINRGILYNWCLNHGSYDIGQKSRRVLSRYLKTFRNQT